MHVSKANYCRCLPMAMAAQTPWYNILAARSLPSSTFCRRGSRRPPAGLKAGFMQRHKASALCLFIDSGARFALRDALGIPIEADRVIPAIHPPPPRAHLAQPRSPMSQVFGRSHPLTLTPCPLSAHRSSTRHAMNAHVLFSSYNTQRGRAQLAACSEPLLQYRVY